MSKRKKISGVVLLRQDVQKLVIEPLIIPVRKETERIEKLMQKVGNQLNHHGKLIEIIARELKRQADRNH